jgi:hypothetical protein
VNLFVKLNFVCALAGLCTIAVGQSQSDVQRQYQEQQRQHQERQREEQRRRDQERDHEDQLRDVERDRNRHAPSDQGAGSGSSALERAAVAAAALAFAAAVQAGRNPDPAARAQHIQKSRMGFIYQRCAGLLSNELRRESDVAGDLRYRGQLTGNRSLQAEGQAIMDRLHRKQVEVNDSCLCVAGRSLQQLADAEWDQMAMRQGVERPWTALESSRTRAVFGPCADRSPSDKELSWFFGSPNR